MKISIFVIVFLALSSICYGQNKPIEEIKRGIENQYIEMCSQLNKQLPLRVDDITILKSIFYAKWVITSYYVVDMDVTDFSNAELTEILKESRSTQKQSIPKMIGRGSYEFTQKELYEYLKLTGLKLRFVYQDAKGDYIGVNQFDYKDFEQNTLK